MDKCNVILEAKSEYGVDSVFSHGSEYNFVKIVEYNYHGDFLILIKSARDNTKIVVNVETDNDFVVKFN